MNRRADRLVRGVNTLVKEVARTVTYSIIEGTPVDTGEARSNWIISLGGPIGGTIAPYTPYPKYSKGNGQGTGESANANAAKQRADGAITARQPGQILIIQNNVPYIGRLNDGYSLQAPASFVNTAIITGIATLNGRTFILV